MLITHQRTVELYTPSDENNCRLKEEFKNIMDGYIVDCDEDKPLRDLNLSDLSVWGCSRIDYTHNFIFKSKKELTVFLNLTKRTSKYKGRRKRKHIKNIKKYDQSTAEANKSYKITFYDKRKQIRDAYMDIAEEDIVELESVSENTIRFEVQCYKSKVRSLKKEHNMDDMCIMNYLDEDYAHTVLLKNYMDSVGTGDFYYFYGAQKVLRESNIKPAMQIRIFNLMRLIAQARSLAEGRKQFRDGGCIIQKTDIVVKGTEATFRSYIKKLASINVNPVLIPKEWGLKYLHNPIDELMYEP